VPPVVSENLLYVVLGTLKRVYAMSLAGADSI
jgi:hypothetical protein